jgi:cytochrome c553
MKKLIAMLVMVGLVSSLATPAFAIKQLNDKFKEIYAAPESKDVSDEFKAKVKEAACNVCHAKNAENSKKVRNPFGIALKKALDEAKFPVKEFGKDATNPKYADQLKDTFKKVTEQKAGGSDQTFAARIKAGDLPGGDKDGKGLPEAK